MDRAKQEMPNRTTIAHFDPPLPLLPRLKASIYSSRKTSCGVNYESNKVRFTAPVPAGSRVRLHQVLKAVEDISSGVRMVEIEATGRITERPAAARCNDEGLDPP